MRLNVNSTPAMPVSTAAFANAAISAPVRLVIVDDRAVPARPQAAYFSRPRTRRGGRGVLWARRNRGRAETYSRCRTDRPAHEGHRRGDPRQGCAFRRLHGALCDVDGIR